MKKKTKRNQYIAVEFIVPRNSRDENTFATVKARVVSDVRSLHRADVFVQYMRKAITQWIRSTEEGREFLSETSDDLNIGDLSSYGVTAKLQKELKKVGILSLSIETNSREGEHNWEYDDNLFDTSWEECDRCGTPLDSKGFCKDITCPFSDRQQDETYTEGK
jgi:hypothetical protein